MDSFRLLKRVKSIQRQTREREKKPPKHEYRLDENSARRAKAERMKTDGKQEQKNI